MYPLPVVFCGGLDAYTGPALQLGAPCAEPHAWALLVRAPTPKKATVVAPETATAASLVLSLKEFPPRVGPRTQNAIGASFRCPPPAQTGRHRGVSPANREVP